MHGPRCSFAAIATPRLPWLPGLDIQGQFLGIGYVIADISDFSLQCTVVSPCTENALHSLWQLIAYKYVCAASQLFFFQCSVSQRSWIQRLFDS